MRSVVNILGKIFIALLAGVSIALVVVQRDEKFKALAYANVQQFFAQSFEGDLQGTVVEINLFSPRIIMNNLVIKPLPGKTGWQWTAQQATLYFSWLTFLLTGKISINIELMGYEADSELVNNQLAIAYHLDRLFSSPDTQIPAILKSLQIRKGILRAHDSINNIQAIAHVHIDMKRINQQPRIKFYITDGALHYEDKPYLRSLSGSVHVNPVDINNETKIKAHVNCSAQIPQLDNILCFIEGSWHYDHGQWCINSSDNRLRIDPLTYDEHDNVSCIFNLPCSYIAQLIPSFKQHDIQGICHGKVNVKLPELTPLTGEIKFDNCTYQGYSIDNATITAHSVDTYHVEEEAKTHASVRRSLPSLGTRTSEVGQAQSIDARHAQGEAKASASAQSNSLGWQGAADLRITPAVQLHGLWHLTSDHELKLELANTTTVQIPGLNWNIKPAACAVHAKVARNGSVDASYVAAIEDDQAHNLESSGVIKKIEQQITVSGSCAKMVDGKAIQPKNYEIQASTDPLKLDHFVCLDGADTICEFHMNDNLALQGSMNYAYIRSWLPDPLRQELNGEGFITIKASKEQHKFTGTLSMEKGVIKIPKLYNFIRSFNSNFEYNTDAQKCTIQDLRCSLNRGSISSKQMLILFDDQYNSTFMHCPLTFDSCFVSWQKDLFAILSGFLLYKNCNGAQSVDATIIADKGQLKSNLFSTDLTKSIVPFSASSSPVSDSHAPVDINVHFLTKDPVHVKTSFLEAQAQVDVTIKKNIQQPELSGSIDVISGELKFPYKPLSITGGSIVLLPEQLDDPMIELTAKNKIKKHAVGLYVTGSLKSPHIHFESSPVLTEEQIISLLLAGSQDSSLNLLMPTLVAQNMHQVLFGPAQSASKLTSYFSGLLNPLAYVRIVPRFTNESGRGGLRGAIEIGVTDKLTGLIEKNFSLTEDTVFEVEYAISDELSVRGIKDEHGDLGGEMEMRWKF